jgi:hypothetical protein
MVYTLFGRHGETGRPIHVRGGPRGILTSEDRTRDRYTIRGYVSTAIKNGHDACQSPETVET